MTLNATSLICERAKAIGHWVYQTKIGDLKFEKIQRLILAENNINKNVRKLGVFCRVLRNGNAFDIVHVYKRVDSNDMTVDAIAMDNGDCRWDEWTEYVQQRSTKKIRNTTKKMKGKWYISYVNGQDLTYTNGEYWIWEWYTEENLMVWHCARMGIDWGQQRRRHWYAMDIEGMDSADGQSKYYCDSGPFKWKIYTIKKQMFTCLGSQFG